jgi:hypothetical protein
MRYAANWGGNLLPGMSRMNCVIPCHKVELNFYWLGIFLRFFRLNPEVVRSN